MEHRHTVFISYSRKDEQEKDALLNHLGILQHTGLIDLWSDDRIGAGADWEEEISHAMEQASVAILLITANFLNSEFILRQEIPKILARRQHEGLIVFPVIAKSCAWNTVDWLTQMNVRPRNGTPVWGGEFSRVDSELAAIAEEVATIVKDINRGPVSETEDRPSPILHHQLSQSKVIIDNPKNVRISNGDEEILRIMFHDCQRLVILSKFGAGLSGSQVLMVHPVKDENSALLPAVIKLGTVSIIEKEWDAYHTCIHNRLPDAASIEGDPVLLPELNRGGLRYHLQGGGGTFEIISLYSYLRHASPEDIDFVFKRLFKRLEQNWRQGTSGFGFHIHASYDRVLPVNLLIKPADVGATGKPHHISPNLSLDQRLKKNDVVQVSDFIVTKVDPEHKSITLNRPPGNTSASYVVRLKPVETSKGGRLGHVMDPIEGIITETRQEKLEAEVRRSLGQNFDPDSQTVSWPKGPSLPNPLKTWPELLNEIHNIKLACIHGDLNLENILVDSETRDVSLIDFADSRRDHVLHDLLRLETEIVTKLIPELLHQHHLPPETIFAFYRQLHLALSNSGQDIAPPNSVLEKPWRILLIIRRLAWKYLWDDDDRTEYYQGLVLYLLGALKFKNLDSMKEAPGSLPKKVAFWGAATMMGLMQKPHASVNEIPNPAEDPSASEKDGSLWPATLPWNDVYYPLPDRDLDIAHLVDDFTKKDSRWGIFVSGLGGIGKTATAIEIGRRCMAAGAFERVLGDSAKLEHLIDGRIVQADDEATLDFESFLIELGTQLERPDVRFKPFAEKRHLVQRLLNQAPYLVVVDNLETALNAEQIVRTLPALLGRSRTLITSRKIVSSDAYPLKLEGLSEPDALFFLRKDAELRDCADIINAPEAILREIHQGVEGQPLALKLIVAQVVNFDLNFALRNIHSPQENFYRFIYWDSWQELSPAAQNILIYLGGSPASVPLAELLDVPFFEDDHDLPGAIKQLINLSLINTIRVGDTKRYAIHQITRRFINSDLPDLWQQSDNQ